MDKAAYIHTYALKVSQHATINGNLNLSPGVRD